MALTILENALKDLESFFNCPLKADHNHSCLVKMGIGISLQIELNQNNQLMIACVLGTLSSSVYRNKMIEYALAYNYQAKFAEGILGFSSKTFHLISFLVLEPSKLSTDKAFKILPPFIKNAKLWKDAIESESFPPFNAQKAPIATVNLFELAR